MEIFMQFLKTINRSKNALFRKIKKTTLHSFLRTQRRHNHFDPKNVRNILLLRLDDKIGDMVVTTGTAFLLAEQGYRVSVLTGPVCAQMLNKCDYLDQVILYKNRMSLDGLSAQNFDVIIDFDDVQDYERLKLAWRMRRSHHVGFNKNLPGIYNLCFNYLDAEQHITKRHNLVLGLFNIHEGEFKYQLGQCNHEQRKVKDAISFSPEDIIVSVNPYSGAQDKDFLEEQVVSLINFIRSLNPKIKVVIVGQASKVQHYNAFGAVTVPESTINTAIEIVRLSRLVVSTDTSIVHIANALNRPLISVYNKRKLKDTGLPGYKIWAPNYPLGKQVIVEGDHIGKSPISQLFPMIEAELLSTRFYQ
jgi:ADP-heptose:LPS heptosyltransferase